MATAATHGQSDYTDYPGVLRKAIAPGSIQKKIAAVQASGQKSRNIEFEPVTIEGKALAKQIVEFDPVTILGEGKTTPSSEVIEGGYTPPPLVTVPDEPSPELSERLPYPGVTAPPITTSQLLAAQQGATPQLGYQDVVPTAGPSDDEEIERIAEIIISRNYFIEIMLALRKANLSPEQVRRLLLLLHHNDFLMRFVTDQVARRPELREYLFARGLDWEFILDNYDFGVRDSIDFFAGFVAGVLKNVSETFTLPVDIAQGLYVLTGSLFSEELAKKSGEFFAAIKKLLSLEILKALGQEWWREFTELIFQLKWFQAGAKLGEVIPDLVEAGVGLVKSGPKIAKGALKATKALGKLAKVSVNRIREWLNPADLARLAEALKGKLRNWSSADGTLALEHVEGKPVLTKIKTGEQFGLDISDQDWEKVLDDHLKSLDDKPDPNIKAIDQKMIDDALSYRFDRLAEQLAEEFPKIEAKLQKELQDQGKSLKTLAAEVGKKLHVRAKRILTDHFEKLGHQIDIIADEALANLLPTYAHNITVGDFVKEASKKYPGLEGLKGEILKTKLGDLKPDLLYIVKDQDIAVLADLMSREEISHVTKTLLYNAILSEYRGVKRVQFGEYYYGDIVKQMAEGTRRYERGLRKGAKSPGSVYENSYASNYVRSPRGKEMLDIAAKSKPKKPKP